MRSSSPAHPGALHCRALNGPRIYDVLLGGKDNALLDKEAALRLGRVSPRIGEEMRANRAFLRIAVPHFAAGGIDQIIELGCGFPDAPHVHEVVRQASPGARVVYMDIDEVVALHARTHLHGPGVHVISADVADIGEVLERLAFGGVLDLRRRTGILAAHVLDFVPDGTACEITQVLGRMLTAGSGLALSHICTSDLPPAAIKALVQAYDATPTPLHLRDRAAIEAFFTGFRLDRYGLVPVAGWGPVPRAFPPSGGVLLGGVGFLQERP
ncbi:SAM-dependent methyltransferase [Planomonospora sp. ID82291]|uniref:SAM-dependent methyltransferase n=1 Tax=Planomonospora sp. ID82291 TaxID=2738136 RepID=UPI0018C44ADD|nr:SAM-dependent methyltransferase [Planomonospora sp. ID82291]MBG0818368.1 SAM-dependent methyltransferase [Planomonospora sp. ID82291]